jgi:hypothetical protein
LIKNYKNNNNNNNNNSNKSRRAISAVALASVLILSIGTLGMMTSGSITPQKAYAITDANGIVTQNPVSNVNQALTFPNQYYLTSTNPDPDEWDLNFRTDGSMRISFVDDVNTDSVLYAGYVRIPDALCTSIPDEDISVGLNGGPHSNTDPNPAGDTVTTPAPNRNFADTMWIDMTDLDGTESRFRVEKTHATYSTAISGFNHGNFPLANDVCENTWTGFQGYKINWDSDCNGGKDKITIASYIDVSGLDGSGDPQNNWVMTYRKQFDVADTTNNPASWNALKRVTGPWVSSVGFDSMKEQIFRVDGQDPAYWGDDQDPPYQYFTVKRVTATKTNCGSGALESSAEELGMPATAEEEEVTTAPVEEEEQEQEEEVLIEEEEEEEEEEE